MHEIGEKFLTQKQAPKYVRPLLSMDNASTLFDKGQRGFMLIRNGHNSGIPKPHNIVTANGDVQTNEQAQVYVFLFPSEKCEEHGQNDVRTNGQKPHQTTNGQGILRRTEKFVPVFVQGLSFEPRTQVRLRRRHRKTH